ncbi:hypothetical protein ABZ354_04065 [Streptomyces sp. NPDC005925]|uniref:hypothetical protein n=1 Tax=Streptomyces sp. NPDC005925 TaxID=3157172 RepID=UPI0033CB27E5
MTACAIEPTAEHSEPDTSEPGTSGPGGDEAPRTGCALTADRAYAARLARNGGGGGDGDAWFPERWTLDGPEPYAVPLPGNQPEEPGTEVQPMGDGRVLIHRLVGGRHAFALLYPTGPGTGELPLGTVECPTGGTRLRLLPPAPGGDRAYALAVGRHSSTVWLVAGGAFGPERLAEVPGHCSGGVWLDGTGRMLALDRESGGRTKSVVVDLERGGEVSPLLQIAEDSDDRLLLADPAGGLLLIASDAPSPGEPRLGWGVLGSALPVRFPESLRMPDCTVTPFAVQPGQVLTPEACAVALRMDGPLGSWVGVWRPADRQLHHLPAPEGWLRGTGWWTKDGRLHLPFTTREVPCGVARFAAPWGDPDGDPEGPGPATGGLEHPEHPGPGPAPGGTEHPGSDPGPDGASLPRGAEEPSATPHGPTAGAMGGPADGVTGRPVTKLTGAGVSAPVVSRPVPLREAPLGGL